MGNWGNNDDITMTTSYQVKYWLRPSHLPKIPHENVSKYHNGSIKNVCKTDDYGII